MKKKDVYGSVIGKIESCTISYKYEKEISPTSGKPRFMIRIPFKNANPSYIYVHRDKKVFELAKSIYNRANNRMKNSLYGRTRKGIQGEIDGHYVLYKRPTLKNAVSFAGFGGDPSTADIGAIDVDPNARHFEKKSIKFALTSGMFSI